MNQPHVMDVFLTVNAEVWPNVPGWPEKVRLEHDDAFIRDLIDVNLQGRTTAGNFGIDYQIATLKHWGLRASYFVEPLASGFYGHNHLRETVGGIVAAGQDVQLHLHTEWLSDIHDEKLPASFRQFLHQFDEDEQVALIRWGIQALKHCGVPHVCAFRAGGCGADVATLRALTRNGIFIDSSYDPAYALSNCRLPVDRLRLQPWQVHGVLEFPVSVFEDYPGHSRHAQLCACSLAEMTRALDLAWEQKWHNFTILLHSFELVRDRMVPGRQARPDWTNIHRFEHLCEFLAANRSRFRTQVFSEIVPEKITACDEVPQIKTGVLRTVSRIAQQAWTRIS